MTTLSCLGTTNVDCKWRLGDPHKIPIDGVLHCPKCCGPKYWIGRIMELREEETGPHCTCKHYLYLHLGGEETECVAHNYQGNHPCPCAAFELA